jgi:hypothetical protein
MTPYSVLPTGVNGAAAIPSTASASVAGGCSTRPLLGSNGHCVTDPAPFRSSSPADTGSDFGDAGS